MEENCRMLPFGSTHVQLMVEKRTLIIMGI